MPAEPCAPRPGRVEPLIDRNRCEGKGACVSVCPHRVFEMGRLSPDERALLSLRGRLKAWAHGGRQARVVGPDACHACGLCVQSCPEQAITLQPKT